MSASDYVHLEVVKILHETDAAFLLLLEGGEEVWIPKSHVADAERYSAGDRGCTVSITKWIAGKKGLD